MTTTTLIIGSGIAGFTLARELRKLDPNHNIHVFTRDDGGSDYKPNLSTALIKAKTAEELQLKTCEQMAADLQITIHSRYNVTTIDPTHQQITANDQIFHYDNLVLAVGAQPHTLRINTPHSERYLSINNLDDYRHFRQQLRPQQSIAIIGAGLIGCEFANDLALTQHAVHLIDLMATPLSLLIPPTLGMALLQRLQEHGVIWHGNSAVTDIHPQAASFDLITQTTDLQPSAPIIADLIISAIGLKPNTELAAQAGLTVNRGIVVNQYLQTSAPQIYALGDCIEINHQLQPYVAPIIIGAKSLAHTIMGQPTSYHLPPTPIVVKTSCFPLVILPPPPNTGSHWQIEGNYPDYTAVSIDQNNCKNGFILACTATKERAKFLQQMGSNTESGL